MSQTHAGNLRPWQGVASPRGAVAPSPLAATTRAVGVRNRPGNQNQLTLQLPGQQLEATTHLAVDVFHSTEPQVTREREARAIPHTPQGNDGTKKPPRAEERWRVHGQNAIEVG